MQHIELNFALGLDENYNINDLQKQYRYGISKFLNNYEHYVFAPSYIILDRVLNMMFSQNKSTMCIFPHKISTMGQIMSCDRLNSVGNKAIADICSREDFSNIAKSHVCRRLVASKCKSCEYQNYCCACHVSMKQIDPVSGEPVFCIIMKTIIDEAHNFFENHRRDLRMALHFMPELAEKIRTSQTTSV